MQIYYRHAQSIIEDYDGGMPLSLHLKAFYKTNPKLGSRDRKALSEIVFSYFRLVKAIGNSLLFEKRVNVALLICEASLPMVVKMLPESWQLQLPKSLEDRLSFLTEQGININLAAIEEGLPTFSEGITRAEYALSIPIQPQLFLRMRIPKIKAEKVLETAGIACEWISDSCLSLPNTTKVAELFKPSDYVIMDASSQATGQFLHPKQGQYWWDVCSGAGGKSLLLKDKQYEIKLTATDIRGSILQNLTERFRIYHKNLPHTMEVNAEDSTALSEKLGSKLFDGIICDVPCSGSGTWARTPEELVYYKKESLAAMQQRQALIATNAARFLKPNGTFLYITCSIFKQENEDVVEKLLANTSLILKETHLLNGIGKRADSMFVAVFSNQ